MNKIIKRKGFSKDLKILIRETIMILDNKKKN